MDNFKKAFIRAATKYAEYVELKMKVVTEIKTTPLKSDNSKRGKMYVEHTEPTVSEKLCEEIRTLNAVAAAVGKMEEIGGGKKKEGGKTDGRGKEDGNHDSTGGQQRSKGSY